MIKKCIISGNDFISTNGEIMCPDYYKAYQLGFEEGKKSVQINSETVNTETNTN